MSPACLRVQDSLGSFAVTDMRGLATICQSHPTITNKVPCPAAALNPCFAVFWRNKSFGVRCLRWTSDELGKKQPGPKVGIVAGPEFESATDTQAGFM